MLVRNRRRLHHQHRPLSVGGDAILPGEAARQHGLAIVCLPNQQQVRHSLNFGMTQRSLELIENFPRARIADPSRLPQEINALIRGERQSVAREWFEMFTVHDHQSSISSEGRISPKSSANGPGALLAAAAFSTGGAGGRDFCRRALRVASTAPS